MARPRLLAIAVANRKVAYVLFKGDDLVHWKISNRAGVSPVDAAGITQSMINKVEPAVVVTQKITPKLRKSLRTQKMMAAVARVASENYLLDVSVERIQHHANKYIEAEALAKQYPELLPWLPPKRRLCDDREPRNTILFEAVALGNQVLSDIDHTTDLAIALG